MKCLCTLYLYIILCIRCIHTYCVVLRAIVVGTHQYTWLHAIRVMGYDMYGRLYVLLHRGSRQNDSSDFLCPRIVDVIYPGVYHVLIRNIDYFKTILSMESPSSYRIVRLIIVNRN